MPRVVRMMAHVETDLPRADITHCYLHGAAALRSDLTRVRSVPDDAVTALRGPVLVVGTGLLGTSIALACRRAGLDVLLSDVSPEHVRTASGLGAGRPRRAARTAPSWSSWPCRPTMLGEAIVARADRDATRSSPTWAASSPGPCTRSPRRVEPDVLRRYVGSHPMAGSERSGPAGRQRGALRRPALGGHAAPDAPTPARWRWSRRWPSCAGPCWSGCPRRSTTGRWPAPRTCRTCSPSWWPGGSPDAPGAHLALSGQGVRDVTRVAGSDPALWQQIVAANADAVLELLGEVRGQLDVLIAAVRAASGTRSARCCAAASPARTRSRASTAARCGPPRRCSSPSPTTRASWPGCSPTPAPAASTSRTSASTTTRAATPAWWSWSSRRARAQRLSTSLESRGWVTHR